MGELVSRQVLRIEVPAVYRPYGPRLAGTKARRTAEEPRTVHKVSNSTVFGHVWRRRRTGSPRSVFQREKDAIGHGEWDGEGESGNEGGNGGDGDDTNAIPRSSWHIQDLRILQTRAG